MIAEAAYRLGHDLRVSLLVIAWDGIVLAFMVWRRRCNRGVGR